MISCCSVSVLLKLLQIKSPFEPGLLFVTTAKMCYLHCRTRARFDPREQAKGLQTRNEEAQEAAKKFADRLLSGGLNSAAKDFNQGEGPSEPK